MKITFEVYGDQVVNALCVAARDDLEECGGESWLITRKISKRRIKEIVTEVIRTRGVEFDGWNDDLSDIDSAEINGWAIAQASRYTW